MLCVGACCVLKCAPPNSKIKVSIEKFHCFECSRELVDRRGNIRNDIFCNIKCKEKFLSRNDKIRFTSDYWKKNFNSVLEQLKEHVNKWKNKYDMVLIELKRKQPITLKKCESSTGCALKEEHNKYCKCGYPLKMTREGTYYPRCFDCESKIEKSAKDNFYPG